MLLDECLLDIVWHQLVACESSVEGSTSTSERTQGDAVACQFLERNLGIELLIATLCVHTHDDGTAALKVTHHITHVVSWHEHLKVVDRLEDLWTSILKCL